MADSAPPGVARSAALRILGRIAREPLFHFFCIAIVIFAINAALHGAPPQPRGRYIEIAEGRVAQIAENFRLLAGRPPSRGELEALVRDYADEEIAYREAIALGLDVDDTIVRRRMRQKLEFLADDAGAVTAPSETALQAWFDERQDAYRLAPRVAFRQILASDDRRGARADADAVAFLQALRAGGDPQSLGDSTMLPAALPLTTQEGVAALFGDAFAAALFAETGTGWAGPIRSPYGAHVVRITAREAGRAPRFSDVRDSVMRDWIEARRRANRDAFLQRLRARYRVAIDWPEPYRHMPPPRDIPPPRRPTSDEHGD